MCSGVFLIQHRSDGTSRGASHMSNLLCWQVGAVRITRVQELEAPGMRFIVPQATVDNLAGSPWLTPFLAANGEAMGSVNALIVEVAERRMLVDTCIGNDKERRI